MVRHHVKRGRGNCGQYAACSSGLIVHGLSDEECQVILVEGSPGVGKTSLIRLITIMPSNEQQAT